MRRLRELDYHGLTASEAMVRFAADYRKIVRLPTALRKFAVIHGYGSTGDGGIIKALLHRVLEFQRSRGALLFQASEGFDSHAGYTVITARAEMQQLPLGLFASLLAEESESALRRAMNVHLAAGPTAEPAGKLGTLPPSALGQLDTVLPPAPAAAPEVPRGPKSFAELYPQSLPPAARKKTPPRGR